MAVATPCLQRLDESDPAGDFSTAVKARDFFLQQPGQQHPAVGGKEGL